MLLKTNLISIWRSRISKKHLANGHSGMLTILGRDLEMEGNLKLKDNLEVYGLIHGNIEMIDSHLFIASGSKVQGNIIANTAEINGEVKGDINCKSTLKLGSSASVRGTITCSELITISGSNIIGRVNTSPQAEKDTL